MDDLNGWNSLTYLSRSYNNSMSIFSKVLSGGFNRAPLSNRNYQGNVVYEELKNMTSKDAIVWLLDMIKNTSSNKILFEHMMNKTNNPSNKMK